MNSSLIGEGLPGSHERLTRKWSAPHLGLNYRYTFSRMRYEHHSLTWSEVLVSHQTDPRSAATKKCPQLRSQPFKWSRVLILRTTKEMETLERLLRSCEEADFLRAWQLLLKVHVEYRNRQAPGCNWYSTYSVRLEENVKINEILTNTLSHNNQKMSKHFIRL